MRIGPVQSRRFIHGVLSGWMLDPARQAEFVRVNTGRAMVVKTQLKGGEVTGLHVGARNVRRYFPKGIRVIELELDGLQIQCGLSPEFWNGRPEIHDPRLCEWLDFKVVHRLGERKQVKLAMMPTGKSVFRLRSETQKVDPFSSFTAA